MSAVTDRSVTNKTSHLGRTGQFAAMTEILARGWNVAIPEVDVGDDVFVAQDDGAQLARVQLKTTVTTRVEDRRWRSKTVTLPLRQLMRQNEPVPLTYAFAVRVEDRWQFIVVPRDTLRSMWDQFQEAGRVAAEEGRSRGGRPTKVPGAPASGAGIQFTFTDDDVTAWGGRSFQAFRNNWDRFELLMLPSTAASTELDPSQSPEPQPPNDHEEDAQG